VRHAEVQAQRHARVEAQNSLRDLALRTKSRLAALMHGDVFFGMFFGAATGVAAPHLIRRSIDL
jgi:hypothetical protein